VKRVVPLFCALALVSVLSGCSVATQNTATPLPPNLKLGPTTTTTTPPASHATHQLNVYFMKEGRLFAVPEYYSTDPLDVALAYLGAGPSAGQTSRGITTALISPAAITSAAPIGKNGVALIEVDSEFTSLPGEALEEAFAQIVFTVTGLPNGPSSVKFQYLGYPLDALVPPGQLLSRGVTPSDYCIYAPAGYIPCQKITGTVGT
jgi:hypothetical protein